MFVRTKKEFLHYPIGKELEITQELFEQHPDTFDQITQVPPESKVKKAKK